MKVVPFLDRSDLVHLTTHTVMHNLTEGIILVAVILFLFLGNVRGALIVALTIPFSLLFASICLDLTADSGEPAVAGRARFRHDRGRRGGDGREHRAAPVASGESRRTAPCRRKISEAAHEVQRPVFYAIAIIITAYLPIFTLQARGRAAVQADGLDGGVRTAGALIFSMFVAPVLASVVFPKGTKEWHNPVMALLTKAYDSAVGAGHPLALGHAGAALLILAGAIDAGRGIGSEFLPHLDEGAIWVRGTLAPSTGPTEGIRLANQARMILASFPEVTTVTSQVGRPDDGTDTTGFFNTEYFVDLKPKEQWRPVFHQDKEELIAAMNRELEKIRACIWNFSQPIADNMEEAVSGVKGELAIKVYGDDLKTLEDKGDGDRQRHAHRARR